MYNDNVPFLGRDDMDRQPQPMPVEPELSGRARIKVIGVGGAGNNAVNRMIDAGISSAEYIAVNTDAQILSCSKAKTKIQIGAHLTKGLGAGADPEIGRAAAEESKEELVKAVEKTDLLFITAGMGGGTGTGAAPVIAKIAKDMKILTVAVVTEPFSFEGKRRMDNTMKGIDNLRKYVDTLIIIPNEKIGDVVPRNAPMAEALRVADEVLKQGIRGIADLIVTPALINLDFADVKTILKDRGLAHMGVGVAKGENRIMEAVRLAVNCPLLETTIEGATGVILNVVGGNDLTFDEVKTAANLIHGVVDYSANIIFGACIDENISDEVEVTVIATGFPAAGREGTNQLSSRAPAYQQQRPQPARPPMPQQGQAQQARPQQPSQRPLSAFSAQQQQQVPQQPQPQAPQGYQRPQQPGTYYGNPPQPPTTPRGAFYGNEPRQPQNAYYGTQPQPQQNLYDNPQAPAGYPQGAGYPQSGAAYAQDRPQQRPAPQPQAPASDDYTPDSPQDQKLPPFVQRLLGKKK